MIPVESRSFGGRARSGQDGRLRLSFERRGGGTALVGRYASAPFGAVRANHPDGSSGGKARSGQRGRLRLSFERRGGGMALVGRYASTPFGAVRANHPDGSGMPEVQITNPSGGVPGGDRLRSMTRIYREDVAEAIDGLDLAGAHEPFGGYPYAAAAYVLASQDPEPLTEDLHATLLRIPAALASASAPSPNLCAVRVLTHNAHALYAVLNGVRALARKRLDLPDPAREVW